MNHRLKQYYLRFKAWLPKPMRSALSYINQRLFARRSVLRSVGAWYDVDWRKHYQSLSRDEWSRAYDIVWQHRHNDCVDETDTALILSLLGAPTGNSSDNKNDNKNEAKNDSKDENDDNDDNNKHRNLEHHHSLHRTVHPANTILSYNYSYHDCSPQDEYNRLSAQPILGSSRLLSSVLEVGCGAGSLAIALAQAGFDVTCVDVSRIALSIAAERARQQSVSIRFEHGFAEQLPFADKSFDAITCCHTLEHVRDLQAATSELKRVARHRVIVVVPKQEYRLYAENYHTQFFTTPDDLVRAFGLERYQCHELNFLGRANEFQGEALLYVGELYAQNLG